MSNVEITDKQMESFYDFLLGNSLPEGVSMPKQHRPKLTPKKAMSVIWVLQEVLRVLPANYEQCFHCKTLFNSHNQGHYHSEDCECEYCEESPNQRKSLLGKNFCDSMCEGHYI
jgi:hypothetical protein